MKILSVISRILAAAVTFPVVFFLIITDSLLLAADIAIRKIKTKK